MKLITLNTWGGKIDIPLKDFFKRHSSEIDIFCLQEIFHKFGERKSSNLLDQEFQDVANKYLFEEIQEILKDHEGYFAPVHGESYGLAIFVRKGIEIKESGEIVIYENRSFNPKDEESDHDRKIQWMRIKTDKEWILANIHGHWASDNKIDNEARIEQSKRILNLTEMFKDIPIILCGDFNLRPDTESIKMIDEKMINLISKYNISSTRTSLYTKSVKHADYIFISPDVKDVDFKVLPEEVSDHAALYLEYNV